jgi:peroxiredoxin
VYRQIEALGVEVAVITYDSLELLQRFRLAHAITYTLLRDADSRHIKAYGILNTQYEPGSRGYGVPHPGLLLIDTDGIVRMKFAEPGHRKRPDFAEVIAGVKAWVEAPQRKGPSP